MNIKNVYYYLSVLLFCITGVHPAYGNDSEIIRLNHENIHLLPGGKEVDGMEGDWLIRNDKVVAVIGAADPDREANQMVSSIQGAVIDYTTLAADNDQLVIYYPQGMRVDVPSADTIIVVRSKGASVQLKAVKYPTAAEPYTAETIYTLKDGESFLRVHTNYINNTSDTVAIPIFDKLRGDNKINDAAPAGEGHLAYIYNKWYDAAYGIAVTGSKLYTAGKINDKNLLVLGYEVFYEGLSATSQDPVQLKPGETIGLSRYLLTGSDVADIQKQYASFSSQSYRQLNIDVHDNTGKAVTDAFVEARDGEGALVSASVTDSRGKATLSVTKGSYKAEVTKAGHDTLRKHLPVSSDTHASFILEPVTKMAFAIEDDSGKDLFPVKVEFHGIQGTPDPYLGPDTRGNGNGNLYYSKNRTFEVPLPPGNYRVVVSHGPEYQAEIREAEVKRGETEQMSVKMQRVFTTPGWIIADLHNHSTRSGDSNTGVEDRIINLAASGIEFAPATEHNRISTYTGVIHEMGLQNSVASAAGIELSGRPGPGAINHQNAFPLKIQHGKRGYGAPRTDVDPFVQMKRLYDYDNGSFKLVQQNHPDIGWLYFDKNSDGIRDKGFGTAPMTDVMEIRESMLALPEAVNGGDTHTRSFYWLQMLNLGYRIYGTANSDNHSVGHRNGAMFNYVYTCCEEPEKIDPEEVARQVKKGHVVMSNGPFVDVRINKALPGEETKAPDGKVTLHVRVMHANWCPVNTVQILVNGRTKRSLTYTQSGSPRMFHDGPLRFEQDIAVQLQEDAHIIVLAYGEGEDVGLVTGGRMRKANPVAVTNPVFIDIDNNGFKPNEDLLDQPLPAHNKE